MPLNMETIGIMSTQIYCPGCGTAPAHDTYGILVRWGRREARDMTLPYSLPRDRDFKCAAGLSLVGGGFFSAGCTADLNIGTGSPVY